MNLFIASEVRSGSTYIAESLAYSFSSSYNVDFWDAGKELFSGLTDSSSDTDVLQILDALGLNSAGMRSAKIMCASLSIICREIEKNRTLQEKFFGNEARWIVIRRRNKIKQAVSLATAISSNTWHFYGDVESSPDKSASVSNEAIYEALKMIVISDDYLENFSRMVARSAVIYYEDFIDNELSSLQRIINTLDLPFNSSNLKLSPAKLKKTAQDRKAEAENSFRRYFLENYHRIENN